MKSDPTIEPYAAYGSARWCAMRLGVSLSKFQRTRPLFEVEGFPKVDPLVGLTLKADVDAFLAKRRRVADPDPAAHHGRETTSGVRYHEL